MITSFFSVLQTVFVYLFYFFFTCFGISSLFLLFFFPFFLDWICKSTHRLINTHTHAHAHNQYTVLNDKIRNHICLLSLGSCVANLYDSIFNLKKKYNVKPQGKLRERDLPQKKSKAFNKRAKNSVI